MAEPTDPGLAPSALATGLYAHQQPLVEGCVTDFALGTRRLSLLMATGTGKTLVALNTAHRTAPCGRVLVVVPTLDLLEQTVSVWFRERRGGAYIALCSRAVPDDTRLRHQLTVVADPGILADQIRSAAAAGGPVNVFTTYHSVPKVAVAHRDFHLARWDMLVIDEAHRSALPLSSQRAVLHDDTAIPARHRLYLTATPKILDPAKNTTLTDTDTGPQVASMDDATTFGRVIGRLSLAQAIDEGLLADFRLVAVEVSDTELRMVLNDDISTASAEGLRAAASQVALVKAMQDYRLTRCLTFHNRIDAAHLFAETLPTTTARLPAPYNTPIRAAAVTSKQNRFERRRIKASFGAIPLTPGAKDAPRAALATCRCFGEGVDLPAVDAILFADPKTSSLAIVQAIGRALRPVPGQTKISTILIPVYVAPGQQLSEGVKRTAFHFLYQVLIALSLYDEHFFVAVERLALDAAVPEVLHPCARPERAEEIFPLLGLTAADAHPGIWQTGLEAAEDYYARHHHLNVPSRYRDTQRFCLGWWLGYQRTLYQSGLLPDERATVLDVLGMVWAHPRRSIEHQLAACRAYAARHGHLAPPRHARLNGVGVGRFMARCRREAATGALPYLYRRALSDIYPWWNEDWPPQWHRTYAKAAAAARRGHLAFPDPDQATKNQTPLTRWLDTQIDHLPLLDEDRHRLLEDLGLPHPLALLLRRPCGTSQWAFWRGLHTARTFRRTHHHLNVPSRYTDPDGQVRHLGRWLAQYRYAPHLLTQEQRLALEALGMRWAQ